MTMQTHEIIMIAGGVILPLMTWLVIISFRAGGIKKMVQSNKDSIREAEESRKKIYILVSELSDKLSLTMEKHTKDPTPHNVCGEHASDLKNIGKSIDEIKAAINTINTNLYNLVQTVRSNGKS